MIRKWISIFLLLAMFVSMVPAQALSAGSAATVQTDILINPEYADIISAEDIPEIDPTEYGTRDFGVGGYLTVEEAAVAVREAMKRRETSISVNFYVGENDPYQGYFAAFHYAMTHTGNPTEGDYLAKQYSACRVSYSYSGGTVDGEPVTRYGATYTVTYFTDATQEAEMDTAVAALLDSLNLEHADDYTKFITVYDYICNNITYDYDNLNDSSYHLKHSAYAALVNKTAVCQGYALLLYRLMLELGVDCRYISGMAYNGVDTGSHGWNIVKLDGKYYNADSTWDAGGYEYMWCLQSPETFKWHYRDEEYDTPEFHNAYPMATTDYVYSGGSCTHDYAVVITLPTCTTQGYTTYTCRNCSDSYVDSYTDPSHNYVDGVCTACANVQIVVNGTCGDNLTWTLDAVGKLTISGTGAMYNYDYDGFFDSYYYYTPWHSNRSSIKTVVIEDGVTTIGDCAFYYCRSLTSVAIGDSVTTIGNSAFDYCSNLTTITIPDSVTTIGDDAFYGCDSLTSVTIPDSVTSIGHSAFSGCSGLTSIAISDSITTIGNNAFNSCNSLTSINIPDSVTTIGNNAFYYCRSLTSVTIPDSVTSIGNSAFNQCESLTSVTIPNSVTTIGDSAFYGCDSLTSVTIPDSVTSIGHSAFSGCSGLTSITIPDSVTTIDYNAFGNCDNLTGIWVDANNQYYSSDSFGVLFNRNKTTLMQVPGGFTGTYEIPASVTTIGDNAFNNCSSLTSVTIGDDVTAIGCCAFVGCSSLSSITIPDSVTAIDYQAFAGCSGLTAVTIGNSVTTIGFFAFYNCRSLTSVNIGGSVTTIGRYAFSGCSSLTNITIPDSVTTIDGLAFESCSSLTSVTIPDSITTISYNAFSNCTSLTSIIIPDSVTTIGHAAFSGCSGLTSITIPDSVTTIDFSAFSKCSSLTKVIYCGTQAQWNAISIGSYNEPLINATLQLHDYENCVCTICGADSHTAGSAVKENIVAADCENAGQYDSVIYCTACSQELSRDTVAEPALGHTYEDAFCIRCSQRDPDTVAGENDPQIFVESKKASKGSTVKVTVQIKNNPGFAYLEITPMFDPALTLVDVENGRLFSDFTEGMQYIWAAESNMTTDGILLTLTFHVDESVELGNYQVNFKVRLCSNADEEPVVMGVVPGCIEIVDYVYGDATGDGVVDGFDVIRLKKYLANYNYDTGTSTIEISAGADATGDGNVDGFDVIRLKKYLANYNYDTGISTVPLGPQ